MAEVCELGRSMTPSPLPPPPKKRERERERGGGREDEREREGRREGRREGDKGGRETQREGEGGRERERGLFVTFRGQDLDEVNRIKFKAMETLRCFRVEFAHCRSFRLRHLRL